MEQILKLHGSLSIDDAFATVSMQPFTTLLLFLKKKKISTLRKLFGLMLADEVEFVSDFKKALNNKDFIVSWIKEMNVVPQKKTVVAPHKKEVKKIAYLPRRLQPAFEQTNERKYDRDADYLTATQIKHLSTYGKCVPSFNISKIMLPIFESLGYSFKEDATEFELLWNVLLQFSGLQMIFLEQFNIVPIKDQAKCPIPNSQFGSLKSFLALDLMYRPPMHRSNWEEPITKYGYSFSGRPWKFLFGETELFEETYIPGISLFEQLLTFGVGLGLNKLNNIVEHPFFQTKKKSVILLLHHLILCVLFGNQIKLEDEYQPKQFKEFTCTTQVPKLHDYFLNIMKDVRPISVSTTYFKHNNIFGDVELDLLAHPGNKKTYVWIQKIDNESKFKLFLFPKITEEKEETPTKTKSVHSLQTMTTKDFLSSFKPKQFLFRTCEIEDNTLLAIKHTQKQNFVYRMMPTKEYNHLKTNQLRICIMTNMTEKNIFETMITFAKSLIVLAENSLMIVIIYKSSTTTIVNNDDETIQICDSSFSEDNDQNKLNKKIVIMDNKTALRMKFEDRVGFFLIPDTVKHFHHYSSMPQHGYFIISSDKTVANLNVSSLQNLFFAKKQHRSLLYHYDFFEDISVRIVSKSQLTSDREEQDKEYEQMERNETTTTTKIVSTTVATTIKKRVRPCEKSSLLQRFPIPVKKVK